jgi:hypothetical protein
MSAVAATREAAIWDRMVNVDRRVSRDAYRPAAEHLAHLKPDPGRFRVADGREVDPVREPVSRAKRRPEASGRRPSHASNSTKPIVR